MAAQHEAEEKARAKEAKAPPKPRQTGRAPSRQEDDGLVHDVVTSGAFKDFMRTAAREIARGMFKSGRR